MLVYSQICTKILVLIKPEVFIFSTFFYLIFFYQNVLSPMSSAVYCWMTKVEKKGQFHSSSHHINKSASVNMERT